MMLEKTGFSRNEAETLMAKIPQLVIKYERSFKWWERKTKQKNITVWPME